ncbi:MACPF domain-containing protein NSL1-like [Pistacia vera]|uniref:MACPF domain-containing protein NSL1-like n=1 Tax=Pistacia vera TaxID=55513 RepID=UPI0012636B49|nr:MACPF domain-containing protein NSL1-like [Pistacia vera]XP_031279387.1 MACPF domain-containing protein NSL1-like [Pistacia vera]
MAASHRLDPQSAAEKAVSVIGFGYDLCSDVRLTACKPGPSGSRLIEMDQTRTRDLVFPGGVVVKNVCSSIKCDKGERTRFRSDVLSFNQMSEKFNREMSLSGKIPSGHFNAMFLFNGCWQKDASAAKSLAFDGWFISLYNVELARSQVVLSEQVKQEVPTSWDPAALAEFIEKYGTHIVVGVKMGGKDVVHVKQLRNSNLLPPEVLKSLKQLADERFSEEANPAQVSGNMKDEYPNSWNLQGPYATTIRPPIVNHSKNNDMMSILIRRGGVDLNQSHNQWLSTISQSPNAISMSFVPVTSLLAGVPGTGFLTHAVNLYLRYKPPIEELHQFLEFQLPRQWAPVYGDLPLGLRRRKQASPSLQFTFMGPKLYVNTMQVDSGNRPVTGIRLYLEGKKSDHLAIHLQHLSTVPQTLQLTDDHSYEPIDEPAERGYYEPVKWSIFSHVCTAPVQYNGARFDDCASIVTKAWFEVKVIGMKKVLFLRLGFSMVASAKIRRSEWDGPSTMSRKSGVFSMLISQKFSTGLSQPEKPPEKVDLNSAVFPGGPPQKAPKMSNFVDTKEMVRGPEDPPGYWVVTGAKLCVEDGRISIKGKFSLLTIMSEDSMLLM